MLFTDSFIFHLSLPTTPYLQLRPAPSSMELSRPIINDELYPLLPICVWLRVTRHIRVKHPILRRSTVFRPLGCSLDYAPSATHFSPHSAMPSLGLLTLIGGILTAATIGILIVHKTNPHPGHQLRQLEVAFWTVLERRDRQSRHDISVVTSVVECVCDLDEMRGADVVRN